MSTGHTGFNAFCEGEPTPQGSASAFLTNLAAVRKGARPIVVVTSANPKLKKWRKTMAATFDAAMRANGLATYDGPLHAKIDFVMPRQSTHPKTKDGKRWSDKQPDLDKLFRAAGDSLEDAAVIVNDARICKLEASKRFARLNEAPGVRVTVTPLAETDDSAD